MPLPRIGKKSPPPQYEKEFALHLSQWGQMRKNLKEHPDIVFVYFTRLYELTQSLEKRDPRVYRRQLRRIARLILWDRAIFRVATATLSVDSKSWFVAFIEPILAILEKSYPFNPDTEGASMEYRFMLRSFRSGK